ncbi:MAG TPA: type II toxin-antitoxin system mRNA interferase toxin, RelE/StbE family [Leptospiraceae bacterium]|nr:type II toxin-antitoxin system mRNA interferase toxin, RelE/StbE family [Spirochaetaceae bacterium]HBS04356.1 type II toxin-antitoxin system mRNA interferase toxin, RelE/StbE family [Leptospiraceae bacterium]|tara:strand:- start:1914 stop:2171 length:258 start_codon:yes stop_codon:yes gene_type:complete
MIYELRLKKSAEKELLDLDRITRQRVVGALENLAQSPGAADTKKLKGSDAFRLRVGQYRVLYTIDHKESTIEIYSIAHRKDAYRR